MVNGFLMYGNVCLRIHVTKVWGHVPPGNQKLDVLRLFLVRLVDNITSGRAVKPYTAIGGVQNLLEAKRGRTPLNPPCRDTYLWNNLILIL